MEYNNIAIGSSGQFWKVNSTEWQDRINEMFAFMDGLFADPEFAAAYVRPKLHMLRGIAVMDSFRFDSADSVNVAVNHGRQAKKGEDLDAFISRVEGKASQGEGHGDAIIGTAAEISAELERHIRFFVKENEEVDVVHVQDFDLAVELLCPVMAESKYAAAILGEPAATVLTMDCTVKHVTNEEALGRTLR